MKNTVIGLTGPTGAGKGAVAAVFESLGAFVIDCDSVAREVVCPGEPALTELVDAFGREILLDDGSLDRKRLAELAFATGEGTATLNGIAHPHIRRRLSETINRVSAEHEYIVLDAPTLFESGVCDMCGVTVAVTADDRVRLERIMERDGLTKEQALRRMSAQQDNRWYAERCDIAIANDGDFAALRSLAADAFDKIKSMKGIDCNG